MLPGVSDLACRAKGEQQLQLWGSSDSIIFWTHGEHCGLDGMVLGAGSGLWGRG